ncbi:SUMF1/EgtB/PvdO family nonheme iron enzyme [Massilia sp. H6]|uniref:SUMF1/EgtB/PvdO family nonheme iron enzyme n=1 Tax=Massilia sp. H6 TaxID=2970464 RepID=UPI00216A9489|nr:SUMF1/EgtB/PvdO family nonheme iron enzyme [Massilia sp. H6]UVW26903.1 SUMF1/EgtB/PvdO family nonheme iron enzyme [Massilia sp. H6]
MQTAIDKIRELRALHEDGLLSRHEFDQRKNAILDAVYAPAAVSAGLTSEAAPTRSGTEIGLMAGQELGPQNRRYRLERLIALGGMGQVWQATDLATHAELGHSAQVALKILPPHLTESASHAKLLIQEATRARRLAHEHIVRVYEWAQDPATTSFFLIMECLDGEDLDALLAREGRLPLERALALLEPVAAALDYAWDKHGLVHRDIKPGNVFVTRRGEVKLLDFGIAARVRASGAAALPLEPPGTSGTAGYRAPEAGRQQGQPAPALDVYAVAVMVYQMLDGALPPGSGRAPGGMEPHQWQVLRTGLARDPAARPASVRALLEALRGATGPTPDQIAAQAALAQAAHAQRERELAARQQQEEQEQLAARAEIDRQRREQQRLARASAEQARAVRKEALRQQLLAKRDEVTAKTREAQEQAQRKLVQARAAASYLAEHQRARDLQAARTADDLARLIPDAASPVADGEGVLRDAFLAGAGRGPALVLIAAGRFQMGSHEHERKIAMQAGAQEKWLQRETPQRWVGIEQPFAMGRLPVTVGEWRAFVAASSWQPKGEVHWDAPGFAQTDAHPVVGVSWDDAQAYLAWLSAATGQRYRLPSEAEWEYACRAGTKSAFSFGDTISPALANYDGRFSYHGGALGAYRRGTTPGGMFPPNAWGLYDMHGNVWEWVQDALHANYEGAPLDGRAWESGGDASRRILRGGSWQYHPRYLRSALRNAYAGTLSNDIIGFRVVRELN